MAQRPSNLTLDAAGIAERDAYFADYYRPEAAERRRAARERSRQWRAEAGLDDTVGYHRNGSGNGCGFVAAIAESAVVVTWRTTLGDGTEADHGTVAVSLDELVRAAELPVVDDAGIVARLDRVLSDLDGAAAFVLEAFSLGLRRGGVEHLARKIVIVAPRDSALGADRVAVLDLALAVDEGDVTVSWRPEVFVDAVTAALGAHSS